MNVGSKGRMSKDRPLWHDYFELQSKAIKTQQIGEKLFTSPSIAYKEFR